MKKIPFILLATLIASCSQKKNQEQVIIYDNSAFEQISEYGEEIKADTAFSRHMEDITIPLNMSMEALKNRNPEFYEECRRCSTDKELTEKLKSSEIFQKIALEKGLDLRKVSLIQHLK